METHVTVRGKNKNRDGKGFSRAELKEVSIDPKRALKLGIPIDPRRRTKHGENVGLLKRYLKRLRTKNQPEEKNA